MPRKSEITEYVEEYSKYHNIFEQIKDCKYDDISIKVEKYPIYNVHSAHLIIKNKNGLGIIRYVVNSQYPFYIPLKDEELQRIIESARRQFAYEEKLREQNLCSAIIYKEN